MAEVEIGVVELHASDGYSHRKNLTSVPRNSGIQLQLPIEVAFDAHKETKDTYVWVTIDCLQ